MADPVAYWSAVTGVSVGLGIALAVEVRTIREEFEGLSWWARLLFGGPIAAAAIALVLVLGQALNELASSLPDVALAPLVNYVLFAIANVMIASRIIDAVTPNLRRRQRVTPQPPDEDLSR